MDPHISFVIFIAFAILFFLTIIIIIAIKQGNKRKEQIIGSLESDRIKTKNNSGYGKIDDTEYEFEYFAGSRNAPAHFLIKINLSSIVKAAFNIRKETKTDHFFKKLGIVQEIETNDIEFDRKFFIQTEFPSFSYKLLSLQNVRKAIQSIFSFGFTEVTFKKNQIIARVRPLKKDFSTSSQMVENIATELKFISEEIEKISINPIPEQVKNQFWRYVVYIKTALISIASITFLIIGIVKFRPFDGGTIFLHSLSFSLVCFVLFSYFAMIFLKGRSNSHHELIVIWIISLFSFIILGFGVMTTLNGALDKSNENEIETILLRKYYTKSKNSYTYYAVVESWRKGKVEQKIRVSRSFYKKLEKEKSRILIITKPGKFDFEWMVGYQLLDEW